MSAQPCPRNSCQGGYGPCLDVKFTNQCNGRCEFCIEKDGYSPKEAELNVLIGHAIADPSPTVLVLGGEPMCQMARLVTFLEGIRPYKKKIYLTTNGCYMSKENAVLLGRLLDGINISIHHYDQTIANDIIRPVNEHTKLNFIKLAKSIPILQSLGCPVRLNVNLVKGYLDTRAQIDKMIDVAAQWGVDTIRFTELQNVDDHLFVDATKLFPTLADIDPWSDGCEQTVDVVQDVKVIVKIGCGHVVNSRPKPPCTGKSVCHVMYPNGEVTEGWVTAKKPEPKKDTAEPSGFDCHYGIRHPATDMGCHY